MTAGAFYLFRTEKSVDELGPGMLNFIKLRIRESGAQAVKHEDYTDPRSKDQNSLHCALCRDIAKAVCLRNGIAFDEEVTEYMRSKTKRKFGITGTQPDPETGKPEPFLISTTKYSKAQFSKLIEGSLAWALVDLGLDINRPAWADEYKR